MLNPKLIDKYGEGTRKFFDEFISEIGVELADKCYALTTGGLYEYDDVFVPTSIAVCSDDDTCWEIEGKCFNICGRMINESVTASGDDFVMCIPYEVAAAEERGIKIWEK